MHSLTTIHSQSEAHSQQEMGEKFGITKTLTGNCKKTFRLLAGDTILGLVSGKILFFSVLKKL